MIRVAPSVFLARLGMLLIATVQLLVSASCGGSGSELAARGRLAAPEIVTLSAKVASGAPVGIFVTWTRNPSAAVQGYYLYRDTAPIPDPSPDGTISPALRVNGGNLIAQPGSGATVTHNDLFDAQIGTTYYYRVTVVDTLDQESYPSNEMSWQVHAHNVAGFAPASVYWGDTVTISGDTFGAYDSGTDGVTFPSVFGGSVPGVIQSWDDTGIEVVVPDLALTGPISVVVEGTIAQSDTDLVVLHPYLTGIDPLAAFVGYTVTLSGGNFGASQGGSTVSFGATDVSGQVISWSSSQVEVSVPAGLPGTIDVTVTVSAHTSNPLPFTTRAEILSIAPIAEQAGQPITISGRHFGGTEGNLTIGVTQATDSWTDSEIQFVLSGNVGMQTAIVTTTGGVVSNEFAFEILAPLSINLSGIDEVTIYEPTTPTDVNIFTADTADKVELLIDGIVVDSILDGPYTSLPLPLASLTNGIHLVRLRATRNAVIAESPEFAISVLSLLGDINADGSVNDADSADLKALIGLTSADAGFKFWYDTDGDGVITEADHSAIGYSYGDELVPLP